MTRLEGKVTLDGAPYEEAWEEVEAVPLVMYEPVFKGEMTEETEIKVAYDDSHIYVSGKLYHENIDDIRLNSLYRDRYSQDDTFAIVIDPFNDDENALWFFINPGGVRFDMSLSNDANISSFRDINQSWNTYWKAETQINEDGWTAEIRIPFSSIGLQVEDELSEIGVILYRYISKGAERYIYPAIPPNWTMGNAKPSKAQDMSLKGIESTKPLYVTPYLLGGIQTEPQLNDAETGYESTNDFTREAGFDLKYNISTNTTLDATFNTDFAQVEADNQQLNLTRFPLFFPEKRQFFQERSSVFSFDLGGPNNLFFSRRIGLSSSGDPIRIWGGARVTSKVNEWDIGFLNMQTDDQGSIPSENFGVLRVKRKAFNPYSYVGGIITSRLSKSGYNYALGLDGVVNVTGEEYLTVRYAQTFDDALTADQSSDPGNTGFIRLEWDRRTNNGFYYNTSFSRSGGDFNPGIGFILRSDYYSVFTRLGYGVLFDDSPVRRWDIQLGGNAYFRNRDHSVESSQLNIGTSLKYASGAELSGSLSLYNEDLLTQQSFLPKTTVAPGNYSFLNGSLSYQMAPFNKLRTRVQAGAGGFYDGHSYQFSTNPVWNLSKHLELGGSYILNTLRFPDRDQKFTAQIVRFRIQAALDRRFSASTFAQYSNVAELVGLNVRFRYNFGEGRDLWLVYNEQLNTERYPAAAAVTPLPVSDSRVVLLKFSYAFNVNK